MPSIYTARRIIAAARDRHPAFDEQAHPDAVCLRWLSNFQQTLLSRLSLLDDELVVQSVSATLPLANWTAGISLPPHQYLKLPQAVTTSGQMVPVELVPFDQRYDRSYPFPAATDAGNALLLFGGDEAWTGIASILVRYLPTALALVTLADTFVLPDSAEPLLVAALARFLGSRAAAMGFDVDMESLGLEAQQADVTLMDQVAMRRRAETDLIREVW